MFTSYFVNLCLQILYSYKEKLSFLSKKKFSFSIERDNEFLSLLIIATN